jgi:hypothetical protein
MAVSIYSEGSSFINFIRTENKYLVAAATIGTLSFVVDSLVQYQFRNANNRNQAWNHKIRVHTLGAVLGSLFCIVSSEVTSTLFSVHDYRSLIHGSLLIYVTYEVASTYFLFKSRNPHVTFAPVAQKAVFEPPSPYVAQKHSSIMKVQEKRKDSTTVTSGSGELTIEAPVSRVKEFFSFILHRLGPEVTSRIEIEEDGQAKIHFGEDYSTKFVYEVLNLGIHIWESDHFWAKSALVAIADREERDLLQQLLDIHSADNDEIALKKLSNLRAYVMEHIVRKFNYQTKDFQTWIDLLYPSYEAYLTELIKYLISQHNVLGSRLEQIKILRKYKKRIKDQLEIVRNNLIEFVIIEFQNDRAKTMKWLNFLYFDEFAEPANEADLLGLVRKHSSQVVKNFAGEEDLPIDRKPLLRVSEKRRQ